MGGLVHFLRLTRGFAALARWRLIPPPEHAHAFPWWLRVLMAPTLLLGRRSATGLSPGARLARALEGLGPTYVKLGQMLATRPDVIGPQNALDLQDLQDRLPPFSEAAARRAVERDLGRPVDAVFADFGPAVAAASIAQVHKARLKRPEAGAPEWVAVKVLRPHVERRCHRELKALRWAARTAERFVRISRRLEPVAFIDTLAAAVDRELDLRLEAAGADELRERAREDADLVIPPVVWSATGRRVLTLGWVDGAKLNDEAALEAAGVDKPRLAKRLLQLFLSHAMREGVFHADMHPGNLFLLERGRIAFVDFGILGRLDASAQRYLGEILWGFITRDYERAAGVHFEAGYVPERHGKAEFAQALRAVAEPIHGKRASEVSMARVLMHLFEVTAMFDMRLRPELVLLQKTMVTVEGVARSLDPDIDIWEAASGPVEAFITKRFGPEGKAKAAAHGAGELSRLVARLPKVVEHGERALKRLGDGEISLSVAAMDRLAEALDRRGRWRRRIVWMALGAAAALAAMRGVTG